MFLGDYDDPELWNHPRLETNSKETCSRNPLGGFVLLKVYPNLDGIIYKDIQLNKDYTSYQYYDIFRNFRPSSEDDGLILSNYPESFDRDIPHELYQQEFYIKCKDILTGQFYKPLGTTIKADGNIICDAILRRAGYRSGDLSKFPSRIITSRISVTEDYRQFFDSSIPLLTDFTEGKKEKTDRCIIL